MTRPNYHGNRIEGTSSGGQNLGESRFGCVPELCVRIHLPLKKRLPRASLARGVEDLDLHVLP